MPALAIAKTLRAQSRVKASGVGESGFIIVKIVVEGIS